MMEFIKDINEARMTRDSSNARVLTYTDCCERLYLTMLVLEMLRKYPTFSNTVRAYAKRQVDMIAIDILEVMVQIYIILYIM